MFVCIYAHTYMLDNFEARLPVDCLPNPYAIVVLALYKQISNVYLGS